ncbi:MAG: hypothetical protein ACE5IZ_09940 [Dehalococcoidia bacterium]
MIAIIAALEDEAAGLLTQTEVTRHLSIDRSPAWEGKLGRKDVVMARSGPGRQRAQAAADFLLHHYPLAALVSIGFAGAVRDGLRAGDLVLCQRVHAPQEAEVCSCDPALLAQAVAALAGRGIAFHQADALTVPQVVGEPQAKADIGHRRPVAVVEMESYWLAQAAVRRGVPFLVLRAVLDELGDWLPDVSLVDETGVVQRPKAMAYLMRHPERTQALMRIGANVAKAGQSLAAGVVALLEGWDQTQPSPTL